MVVKAQILENDRRVRASARETELGRRLMEIPALVRCWRVHLLRPSPMRTHSSRGAVCRPGSRLVPKQNSSGGKEKIGSISKAGGR